MVAGCRKLLIDTNVKHLQTPHLVTALKDTATVAEALKALADAKVLSAPVVTSSSTEDSDSPVWRSNDPPDDIVGFLDVRDVVSNFLQELELCDFANCKSLLQRMRMLEEKGRQYAERQIKQLTDIGADGDFLHSTQARISLMELVMTGMLQPKSRAVRGGEETSHVVHRIALFNGQGAITDIISQSDIIRFMAGHSDEMGSLGSATIAELGLIGRKVECIPATLCALDAMKMMLAKAISSLAVVGPAGNIIGNFSVSDLRTIMAEQFGALALPVGDFLALGHGEFTAHNHHASVSRLADQTATAVTSSGGGASSEPVATAGASNADADASAPSTTAASGGAVTMEEDAGLTEDSPGLRFVRDAKARRELEAQQRECGQSLALVTPDTPLIEAMTKMATQRVHRVYVVDTDMRPVGVVSCTDVLRKIVESTN